jgi:chromosome segregation ATPase
MQPALSLFAPNVCMSIVRLDGDVYGPSGTMSGSVDTSGSGVFVRAAEERVKGRQRTLEALERKEAEGRAGKEKVRKLEE